MLFRHTYQDFNYTNIQFNRNNFLLQYSKIFCKLIIIFSILDILYIVKDSFTHNYLAMKNILSLFCKVLLIGNICFHSSLFAQKVQPTGNLPVIESRSNATNSYYVILLTGNGGWKSLVQSVTFYLNSKNVSVVAINTQKYLWSEKEPAQIACDIESLIDNFFNKWGQKKIVLMGYSMGAEVLPFAVNCMKEKYIGEINDLILIGPWQKATFEVKLTDYLYEDNKGLDIYPELLKLKTGKGYIICDDNEFSICKKNLEGVIDHNFLGGGHHFGHDYTALSKLIGKRLNLE
jgi:type IV secretory pathway VirJ component